MSVARSDIIDLGAKDLFRAGSINQEVGQKFTAVLQYVLTLGV